MLVAQMRNEERESPAMSKGSTMPPNFQRQSFGMGFGGGAATTGGIEFQARVTAWVAVSILAGPKASPPWSLPENVRLKALWSETGQPVDDLLVTTSEGGFAFLQAKRRLKLGRGADSDFASALDQCVRQYLLSGPGCGEGERWERPLDPGRDRLVLVTGKDAPERVRIHLPVLLGRLAANPPEHSREVVTNADEREVLELLHERLAASWHRQVGHPPSDREVARFASLLQIHILDVEKNGVGEAQAKDRLRDLLVNPDDVAAAWAILVSEALQWAKRRTGVHRESLEKILNQAQLPLRASVLRDSPALSGVSLCVFDFSDRPVQGLVLATVGGAEAPPTDERGNTVLPLPASTRAGDPITLQIVSSPPGDPNWVILSHWGGRVRVPSTEPEPKSDAFVVVQVIERGCRDLLTSSLALAAISGRYLGLPRLHEETRTAIDHICEQDVERQTGLSWDDIEQSLRSWREWTSDPFERGLSWLASENLTAAHESLATALEKRKQDLASSEEKVYEAAFFLGHTQLREGRLEDAIIHLKLALDLRPEDVRTLTNLGSALLFSNRAGEAEGFLFRAFELEHRRPDVLESPSFIANLELLGLCVLTKGSAARAVSIWRNLLLILEHRLGRNHSNLASTLSSLAVGYMSSRQLGRAIKVLERLVAIRVRQGTMNDPSPLRQARQQLASAYRFNGRLRDAERLYGEVLRDEQEAYGTESPGVAAALADLATVSADDNDYLKAESYLTRALKIYGICHSTENEAFAVTLERLARVRRASSSQLEVEDLFCRALAIREKLASSPLERAKIRFELGKVYFDRGDFKAALLQWLTALALYDEASPLLTPDLISIYQAAADLQYRMNDPDEALSLYERGLTKGRFCGLHPALILPLSFGLARVKFGLGQFDEAADLLIECNQWLNDRSESASQWLSFTVSVLGVLGRTAEAAIIDQRFRERLAASEGESGHAPEPPIERGLRRAAQILAEDVPCVELSPDPSQRLMMAQLTRLFGELGVLAREANGINALREILEAIETARALYLHPAAPLCKEGGDIHWATGILLGNLTPGLPEEQKRELLIAAIESHREARRAYDHAKSATPEEHLRVITSLAATLLEFAENCAPCSERQGLAQEAIAVLRQVKPGLEDFKHSLFLGSSLVVLSQELPDLDREPLAAEAVERLRGVLGATQEEYYQAWPLARRNLSLALIFLALARRGQEGLTLLAEAIETARQLIAVQSGSQDLAILGMALISYAILDPGQEGRERLVEAVGIFNQAIERMTQGATPWYRATLSFNLAEALQELGDLDEAIKSYEDVLAVSPDDTQAFLRLWNLLHARLGRYGDALSLAHQWLLRHPGDLGVHLRFLEGLIADDRLVEAEEGLRRFFATDPPIEGADRIVLLSLKIALKFVLSDRVGAKEPMAALLSDLRQQPQEFEFERSFQGLKMACATNTRLGRNAELLERLFDALARRGQESMSQELAELLGQLEER
jgi:tetratricopeptide (TPR) repeat protein